MQAVNLLNAADLAPVREISDADAPHRINVSSVWALPMGKGRKFLANTNGFVSRLVGGWEVSGIYSIQSGFALPWGNVIYNGDPKNIQLPADQRTPEHWFNAANFETAPARQLLGNQVRTWPLRIPTIRGPRQNNIDLALLKQTRISEGKNIEFRAEALNAANHPFFPNPNMTVTSSAERQGHWVRPNQRFYNEQLCTAAAMEHSVLILKVKFHLSGAATPTQILRGIVPKNNIEQAKNPYPAIQDWAGCIVTSQNLSWQGYQLTECSQDRIGFTGEAALDIVQPRRNPQ